MFYKFYSGGGINGELTIFALNKLPIPKIPKPAQQPFIDLVKKILTAKKANPQADTTALEAEIDQLAYEVVWADGRGDKNCGRECELMEMTSIMMI